jgi:hypothetical protein
LDRRRRRRQRIVAPPVLGTADDRAVPGVFNRHQHFIGVPFPIHHMNPARYRSIPGGFREDLLRLLHPIEPFCALFLSLPQGVRPARRPRPTLLIQHADHLTRFGERARTSLIVTGKNIPGILPETGHQKVVGNGQFEKGGLGGISLHGYHARGVNVDSFWIEAESPVARMLNSPRLITIASTLASAVNQAIAP